MNQKNQVEIAWSVFVYFFVKWTYWVLVMEVLFIKKERRNDSTRKLFVRSVTSGWKPVL